MALTEDTIRRIVREELAAHGTVGRLAFTLTEAAEQVGYSVEILRVAARRGELQLSYATKRKPVVMATALRAWLEALPDEPLDR